MLTINDCIALSELTEEEIAAIAEHEHLPTTVAAELGCYLVQTPTGERRIGKMIREDIAAARARRDFRHSAELKLVLRRFLDGHTHRPAAQGGSCCGPARHHRLHDT